MIPSGYSDKRRAVYQIQLWLRAIALSGFPIPLIVPDGIYDEKTKEAVRVFQGLSGVAATGGVDYVTWLALRDDYRKAVASGTLSNPIFPFEYSLEGNSIGPGDAFSLVNIVQAMIEELTSVYELLQSQKNSGIYDEQTEGNVKVLQQVWQLPQTGRVDKSTWNMLANAYNNSLGRE